MVQSSAFTFGSFWPVAHAFWILTLAVSRSLTTVTLPTAVAPTARSLCSNPPVARVSGADMEYKTLQPLCLESVASPSNSPTFTKPLRVVAMIDTST